jgi:phospholipid/cholesterol/gamma-HCH transport system ATP-binding protein
MNEQYLLEIKHLTTKFGDKIVHKDISVGFKQGELILLMGGSGSGKSTFVDFMIDTENQPQFNGKMLWNGQEWDRLDIGYRIGFAPQNGGLLQAYTVGENIAMPLEYSQDLPRELCLEIAWANMKALSLDASVFYKYPSMLSGGMLRRASIARAISLDQEVLILDEPLSGLDPINCARTVELIKSFLPNKTIICITHHFIKADRYAILIKGQLFVGTLEEIRDNPATAKFIRSFEHI